MEAISQGSLSHPTSVQFSDQWDVFLQQDIHFGSLSFGITSFGNRVSNIVCLCSEKQMPRIDAQPNIALVQNVETIRDATVMELVRESVSQALFYSLVSLYGEGTVAACNGSTLPQPARIGFDYLLPESSLKWQATISREMNGSAGIGTELPFPIVGRLSVSDGFAADRAYARIGIHRNLRSYGVTPRTAPTVPGHFPQFYPICQPQDYSNLGAT